MSTCPEFVGTIHIFLGRCRGNPIALYLRKEGDVCSISPRISPWNQVVGVGETPNKAAADFDAKWKAGDVAPEMYSGPHWEGGIKPEKPKPPPKQPPPAPAPAPVAPQAGSTVAAPAPGPLVAKGMLDQGTTPPAPPAESGFSQVPSPSQEATPSPANDPPLRAPSGSS